MLGNSIIAIIGSTIGAFSIIVSFIFLFLDIKNKKSISARTGIIIIAGIFIGVFIIVSSYFFGREFALENVSQASNESDTLDIDNGNIITNDIGDITINGNNNDININGNNSLNTISSVTVQQVTLNHETIDLVVGDTASLLATVLYSDDSTDYSVIWISSNPDVAKVDSNDNVTAITAGNTTITAQASKNNDAKTESCTITVVDPSSAPTGYSIRLSARQASIGEVFKVYVIPNEENITDIQIYTISPSGLTDNFPLSEDGRYYITTETGTWTIYASVKNGAGVYDAQKPEDYVEIEIISLEDTINTMLGQ